MHQFPVGTLRLRISSSRMDMPPITRLMTVPHSQHPQRWHRQTTHDEEDKSDTEGFESQKHLRETKNAAETRGGAFPQKQIDNRQHLPQEGLLRRQKGNLVAQ